MTAKRGPKGNRLKIDKYFNFEIKGKRRGNTNNIENDGKNDNNNEQKNDNTNNNGNNDGKNDNNNEQKSVRRRNNNHLTGLKWTYKENNTNINKHKKKRHIFDKIIQTLHEGHFYKRECYIYSLFDPFIYDKNLIGSMIKSMVKNEIIKRELKNDGNYYLIMF